MHGLHNQHMKRHFASVFHPKACEAESSRLFVRKERVDDHSAVGNEGVKISDG